MNNNFMNNNFMNNNFKKSISLGERVGEKNKTKFTFKGGGMLMGPNDFDEWFDYDIDLHQPKPFVPKYDLCGCVINNDHLEPPQFNRNFKIKQL